MIAWTAALLAGVVPIDAQELSVVATSGQGAPGSADNFESFLNPVIARDGSVGFFARTKDTDPPVVDKYEGFLKVPGSALTGILISDSNQTSGAYWTLSQDTIDRVGPFPIDADRRMAGPVRLHGLFGSAVVLAAAGDKESKAVQSEFVPEKGTSERFWTFIDATTRPVLINDVGQMVFQAIYRFDGGQTISGGGLRYSDDTLANTSIELLPTDAESPDGAGQFGGFEEWSISDTGRVALTGRLFNENQNGNEGITEANGGRVMVQTGNSAWTIVAAEGTLLPEFPANETVETVIGSTRSFDSGFYGVTLNDSGQVAFGAAIYDRVPATGGTPPPASDNKFFNGVGVARIYLGPTSGELTNVITKGESAEIFGNPGSFITGLSRPHLSNGGKLAFIADLGSAADTYGGSGLFTYDSAKPADTATEAIAKTGDSFETGLVFSRLGRSTDTGAIDFAINNRGQVAFIAMMNVTGDTTLRAGLFLKDTDGTLTLIAREGVVMDLVSKLVSEIHFQGGSTASGRAVGLSDNGSVTFRAVFNEGTSAVLVLAPPVPTTQFEWTGALESDNWHAGAGNWKDLVTNDVARNTPGDGEGETVEINSQDVVIDERAVQLKWLSASGSLDVQAPLTLKQSSVIEDLYLGANLTLNGSLRLTGDGSFWSAGMISGPSTLSNAGSLDFSAPGQTLKLLSGLIILDQAVATLVSDAIDLGDKGSIEVMPGGLFLLRDGAVSGSALPASITNRGVLRKLDAGTLVVDVPSFTNEPTGKIEIKAGEFSFEGAGQFAGILETEIGATTRFKSAEVITGSVAGDSLTIRGEGPVLVESSGFQIGAGAETVLENNGPFGGLHLGENADLYGSGRLTIQESGNMRIDRKAETTISAQLVSHGLLEFASGRTTVDSGPSVFFTDGTVIVRSGAEAVIHAVSNDVLADLDFEGVTFRALISGEYRIEDGSLDLLHVGEEAVPIQVIGGPADVRLSGPNARLNNLPAAEEFLVVNGRLQIQNLDFTVAGESVLEVRGTMAIGPATNVTAKRLLVSDTGVVYLNTVGKLPDSLENNGTVEIGASPGIASMDGDYSQSETGSLQIELGGLEAGNDYDQLIVGGTASFAMGSKITITLIDPNPEDDVDEIFIPRTDDVFNFLSAGDITVPSGMTLGDFIEFANLPDGVDLNLDLAVVDGKTQVVLTANSTLTPPAGPRITAHPAATKAEAGGTITFSVGADGATAFTYQWRRNGAEIPGATEATYTLPFAQTTDDGDYSVVVTADGVSTSSKSGTLEVSTPAPNDGRLLNLSTRAVSLTGNNVLIPGFVIEGEGTKALLIRAVGASLLQDPFNIATALENPQMTLRQWTGSAFEVVESNDDWETNSNVSDLTQATIDLGAFALTDSRDAALFTDLDAGRYTVVARGVGDLTGVAIVELFDADGDASTTVLKNISNRGFVGTGASIMIPGLTVSPEGPKTFLMRVVGPALGEPPFNLAGVIEDPKLTVFSGPDAILSNDNWGDSPDAANTAATAALLGAFPLPEGSKDAAMVVTLPPGGYTIKAAGVDGATGTAIVEVYVIE